MVNGFGFCCCQQSDPCGFVEADYVDPSNIAINWSDSLTVQTQDANPIAAHVTLTAGLLEVYLALIQISEVYESKETVLGLCFYF